MAGGYVIRPHITLRYFDYVTQRRRNWTPPNRLIRTTEAAEYDTNIAQFQEVFALVVEYADLFDTDNEITTDDDKKARAIIQEYWEETHQQFMAFWRRLGPDGPAARHWEAHNPWHLLLAINDAGAHDADNFTSRLKLRWHDMAYRTSIPMLIDLGLVDARFYKRKSRPNRDELREHGPAANQEPVSPWGIFITDAGRAILNFLRTTDFLNPPAEEYEQYIPPEPSDEEDFRPVIPRRYSLLPTRAAAPADDTDAPPRETETFVAESDSPVAESDSPAKQRTYKAEIINDELVVRLPILPEPERRVSKSKKSKIYATTHGTKKVRIETPDGEQVLTVDGAPVYISANAWIKHKKAKSAQTDLFLFTQ